MLGILQHLIPGAAFHNFPCVHHDNSVRQAGDNAQIVGDQQNGHSGLLLQIPELFQNLSLNGHIQRGGGLIGNQQPWIGRHGHGNHHTLPLTPGELMRVLPVYRIAIRDAGGCQAFHGSFSPLSRAQLPAVVAENFLHLLSHLLGGIQGCQSILKHKGAVLSPEAAPPGVIQLRQLPACKADAAAGEKSAGLLNQPHDALGGHGLSAAGLSHQRHGLPRLHMEGDATHGLHRAPAAVKNDSQVADLKQRFHALTSLFPSGGHGVPKDLPQSVKSQHRNQNQQARENTHISVGQNVLLCSL